MTMPPGLRKFALATHLTFSVGWIGSILAYLAVGVSAARSQDPQTLLGAWIAMEVIGWFAIVPLAMASLLSGLVMAFGTRWGLFRHYWVLISFVLTVFAAGVLLLHMPDVSLLADAAREAADAGLRGPDTHLYAQLKEGDLLHPGLGLVVLLVVQVLNVYKPRGITRYGWRKQEQEREAFQERKGDDPKVLLP